MRTEKSAKNLVYGEFLQLMTILIGIVNRTVLIKYIGIEVLSLNGLFTEVLAMLSLAELGVGAAITYSLYAPLAEGNKEKISQLMNLFSKAYYIVAAVIMLIGLILTPFIHLIVNEISYPTEYIRIVYMLFVIQTASSYLFSYYGALITADQKCYLVSLVSIFAKVVLSVVQIIIVWKTGNYILFLLCSIAFTLVNNIVIRLIAKRLYPYIDKRSKLSVTEEKEIFSNIKNVFVAKISGTITNSTDNTLISILVNTIAVGFYSNYAIFLNAIRGILTQFTNAITASFGNLIATESGEHCDHVLQRLTYIAFLFGGISATGFYCALSALIEIWLGKRYLLDESVVFASVFCLFVNVLRTPLWTVADVSGLFKENSYTGVLGSGINLMVSIVLGLKFGMAGIFMGTICTYVIQGVMKIKYLYTLRLHVKYTTFAHKTLVYVLIVFVQCLFAKYICGIVALENKVLGFATYCTIAIVVSLVCDVLPFIKSDEFAYCKATAMRMIDGIAKRKSGKEIDKNAIED